MMKTRLDNDVIDCIGMLYNKNEIEWLCPIQQGMVCDEDKIGQRCDWLQRCGLRRNRNLNVMTNQMGCNLLQKADQTTT